MRRAHFDYISFQSAQDCCAGLSLPRGGGDVRGLPISDSSLTPEIQLRPWLHNSDYIYRSPPHHQPCCACLAYLLYSHFSCIPSIHSCHP
jgi:hypothetical protein